MIVELRTLIAVARHGTFAAAGAHIGLTQAAVSGHIRRLETSMGFALFERTGRSAILNAAGLRTLARAESLVAAFDALGQPDRDEEMNGSIRVGAIASAQPTLIARGLRPFRQRFPNCRICLSPGVSLDLMDRIDAGDLDIAVLIRPTFAIPSNLRWVPLLREEYRLLVSRDIAGEDWGTLLREQPFIRYDRGSFGGRQVARFLRAAPVKVTDWIEVDDIHTMVALVAEGLGVAIVPMTEAILPLPLSIRTVALGVEPIGREIGLLCKRSDGSPLQEALVECLVGGSRPPSPLQL